MRVIGLSGPIGAGKTTLAMALQASMEACVVMVSDELRRLAKQRSNSESRTVLADISSDLWVSEPTWYLGLIRRACEGNGRRPAVVDAVRRRLELDALRSEADVDLLHIYVHASTEVLEERFTNRGRTPAEFAAANRHPSESELGYLREASTLELNTALLTVEEECVAVEDRLRGRSC